MVTFKAKSNKKTFDSDLLTHTKMVINLGLYLGNKVYNNVKNHDDRKTQKRQKRQKTKRQKIFSHISPKEPPKRYLNVFVTKRKKIF